MEQIEAADVQACYPEVTLIGRIGAGTFKQVYKVGYADGSFCVVKFVQLQVAEQEGVVYLSTVKERLELEIGLMKAVNSQFIPHEGPLDARIYCKDGLEFQAFSEEFIGEKTLTDLMRVKAFDPSKLKKLMSDIANALVVYHEYESGFVHRDIKPGNIVYREEDETYVLIDPGVHIKPSNPTLSLGPQGTPAYFSPEQAVGRRRNLDIRSDLFALGILGYEIIAGKHPFGPGLDPSWINRLINVDYTPLTSSENGEYEDLIPVVHRLLSRYPHARYKDPQALLLALRGV